MNALFLLLVILIHSVVLQISHTGKSYVAMARPLEAASDTDFVPAASNRLLEQMKVYPDRFGSPMWKPPPQPGKPGSTSVPPPHVGLLQSSPHLLSPPPPPPLPSSP